MERNRLYIILSLACVGGFIWLTISHHHSTGSGEDGIGICMFKMMTGLPCPSCGTTRAVLALISGDISGSLFWNPLGMIVGAIMFLLPAWIFYDLLRKSSTLFRFYIKAELFLRQKQVAISCILLVLGNWAWNIFKDL